MLLTGGVTLGESTVRIWSFAILIWGQSFSLKAVL